MSSSESIIRALRADVVAFLSFRLVPRKFHCLLSLSLDARVISHLSSLIVGPALG